MREAKGQSTGTDVVQQRRDGDQLAHLGCDVVGIGLRFEAARWSDVEVDGTRCAGDAVRYRNRDRHESGVLAESSERDGAVWGEPDLVTARCGRALEELDVPVGVIPVRQGVVGDGGPLLDEDRCDASFDGRFVAPGRADGEGDCRLRFTSAPIGDGVLEC